MLSLMEKQLEYKKSALQRDETGEEGLGLQPKDWPSIITKWTMISVKESCRSCKKSHSK